MILDLLLLSDLGSLSTLTLHVRTEALDPLNHSNPPSDLLFAGSCTPVCLHHVIIRPLLKIWLTSINVYGEAKSNKE